MLRTPLVASIFGTLALLVVTYDSSRSIGSAGYATFLSDDLNDFGQKLNGYGQVAGSWTFSPAGLDLKPDESGELTLRLRASGHLQTVTMWSAPPGWIRVSVSCIASAGDTTFKGNLLLRPIVRASLDGCSPQPDGTLVVRIDAHHIGVPGRDPIVNALDRVEIGVVRALPPVGTLLSLITLIGFAAFGTAAATQRRAVIVAVTAVVVALSVGAVTSHSSMLQPISLFGDVQMTGALATQAVVLIVLAATAILAPRPLIAAVLPALALAWLMALAVVARWQQLELQLGVPLWPDTETVQLLIRQMSHPYDTGVREPLWIWVGWAFEQAFGPTPVALRLFSLVASVLIVPAAYLLGRDYGDSKLLGLIAAALIAAHELLIESSPHGHRTELLILGITAVTYFALVKGIQVRRRVAGLSLSSAALMLTSLSTAVIAGPLVVWAAYKHRLALSHLAAMAVVAAVAVSPNVLYNYQTFGTYSYFATRLVPTFYRNYEFMVVKGTGCDGCPSKEEFRVDWYSGRQITMGAYLFQLHTPGEVVSRILDGFRIAYFERGPELTALLGGSSAVRSVLFLTGMAALVASSRREMLIVFVLALNLTAFVVPLGVDLRLLTGPAALAAFTQAVPLTAVLLWIARRWPLRRDTTRETVPARV